MKKYLTILTILLVGTILNAQVDVTFKVDLKEQASLGLFVAADNQVEVRGSFNDWDFTDNKYLTDPDGDLVYEGVIPCPENATTFYKFFYTENDTWEGDPNREVVVASDPIILDPTYFNKRNYTGAAATITFEVDMSVIAEGNFDPATMPVRVAGSFTDWGTGAFDLADGDGDLIYTGTFDQNDQGVGFVGGDELVFKFIYDDGGNLQWETDIVTTGDNNRFVSLEDGENTFAAFWNNSSGASFADGNILFEVDMTVMEEVGIFDPAVDGMQLRSNFNGWSDGTPELSLMNQDPFEVTKFFLDIPFEDAELGAVQNYKYFVDFPGKAEWTDPYERPFSQGGGNRDVPFEGEDTQEAGIKYYDDVYPDYVIEDGKVDVAIKFSVDMTNAADPLIVANPFDSVNDTVYVVFEQPAFVFSQGWTSIDDNPEMRVLPMTATGTGLVYEATLNVTPPSWNGFEYRYAFSSPVNGWKTEPAGFGDFAYRVRYVEMTGPRAFVQPYDAPMDTWLEQENKFDEWENQPPGITSVGDENTPIKYDLSQNYPNPFNPSTTIKFSIPQSGLVTLKVYNLLGQEVATLLNREINAGTHEYNFNAGRLGSGIYFYTIQAGDFIATKKMMLLK
jgi:hypothetical protein